MPNPNGGTTTSLTDQARQLRTLGAYSGGFYGPGDPLPPVVDGLPTRQWDFAPGVNMVQTPRHTEPFNFKHLRAFANVELVRMAIETRKDQLERLDWHVKPKDNKKAQQEKKGQRDERCIEVEKFLAKPDGATLFQPFFRALEEDLLAIDAPCLERRRNRGGKLVGLELVDGATINLLVDNTGRRPRGPDDVAFQQVLRGVVWANLTNRDLIYAPRNVRTNHLYGFGPVEQIIVTVNTIIRRQAKQLAYFTEGNVPQGIISAPEGWTTEQLREIQEWFDQRISGNAGQQQSVIWTPFNSKYSAFKDAPIKDEFDEWLARIVAFAFSLPPTPFIRQMNKGTAGEDQERSLEEGLEPLKKWRKRLIDQLIEEEFGYPDLEFEFRIETEIDPKVQSDVDDKALRNGSAIIDEIRESRGQDPLPNGQGAKPLIYTSSGVVTLEEALKPQPDPMLEPPMPAHVGAPAPGAAPAGKQPAGKQPSQNPKKKSDATAKYSEDEPRDEHGRWTGGAGGSLDAHTLGLVDENGVATDTGMSTFAAHWIGGDWEKFQIAARSAINGQSKEDFAKEVVSDADPTERAAAMAMHDFAAGVMAKIDGADPLSYPLYRGLVGVHYNVGDTFSESLATWTSKENLARDFAHDAYGTAHTLWEGQLPGAVLKVTGTGMHGINISELDPIHSERAPLVRDAAEHITSGQYRVTSATGRGKLRVYEVERIGNAQASDLKKVVPVELEKYSEDQPRDERGRWTAGGGGESAPATTDALMPYEREGGHYPVQQLTPDQLREAFGIVSHAKPYHMATGDPKNFDEFDEGLDHVAWETIGDFDQWRGAQANKYSDAQPRDDHGRWTSGGGGDSAHVLFEVGPNPDNKDVAARWNSLNDAEKQAISDKLAAQFTPQVLDAAGVQGTVQPALGGFEGEVNPSLVLATDDPFKAAGVLGDTFGQKAMVVMHDKPMEGLSPVGMATVDVPNADAAQLHELQGRIGDLADGFTYRDGRMEVLNFTGKSDEEFANEIDKRLGGAHNVGYGTVYSAYIEAPDYARPETDSHGNPWRQTAGALRQAFSQGLEEALAQTGKVAKFSEDQPRDERGRWTAGGSLALAKADLMPTMVQMATSPDVHQNVIGMTVDGKAIFNPDKSLGIARQDMPQIPDEKRDEFLSSYEHELTVVEPGTLNPTQGELDSYKVGLAANGIIKSDPPLVSSDHYIIDGHHHWAGSVVRAQLNSNERIAVRMVHETRDNLLRAALNYDSRNGIHGEGIADKVMQAIGLAKARIKGPPKHSVDSNKKLLGIEGKIKGLAKEALGKAFALTSEIAKDVLAQSNNAQNNLATAASIADVVDLTDILTLHEPLAEELIAVVSEVVPEVVSDMVAENPGLLASIGVGDEQVLVDQVSDLAVAWAREHAGELVSAEGDESLIASTRRLVRDTVANGLEENIGTPAIIENLQTRAFSDTRAETIGMTEVSMANAAAKKAVWDRVRSDGADMVKEWFISSDDDVCDECETNAGQGEIPYDQAFASGDEMEPGHPRCRCAVTVRVIDPATGE